MPQILPASIVRPSPSSTWQYLFAGTLFLFTFGSCVQLGLAANVHLLPKVWHYLTSRATPSVVSDHKNSSDRITQHPIHVAALLCETTPSPNKSLLQIASQAAL